MKYTSTIITLLFTTICFAQSDHCPEVDAYGDKIYTIVEEMPRFPGCEDIGSTDVEKKKCAEKKMLEYMYKKLKVPTIARENGIDGLVVISFVVEKDGCITHIKKLRGPNELTVMYEELICNMPTWIPGKHKGQPVPVCFRIPFRIHLSE